MKATCLLIGEKDASSDFVKSVQILTPLADLDLDDFKHGLRNIESEEGEGSVCYGVNYKTIKSEDLLDNYDESWAFISQARYAAEKWLNDNLSGKTVRLSDLFNTRRGRVANQGGSHLIFPDYNTDTWNLLEGLIPEDWLKPGIRVVDSCDDVVIKNSNAPNQVLSVDNNAFDEDHDRHEELLEIVRTYHENLEDSSSSQTKKKKSVSDLLGILQNEQRYISEQYTVLIPRNIRRNARAFLAETPIYATTNLVEAYGRSKEDQYLLASWVLSVFAQLHFEYMAKDQEGTRKLETTGQIYDLYVPNFENISSDQKQRLISVVQDDVEFLNLYNPSSREVDEIWAEILWPDDSESKMNKAFDLMYDLVYERDPK